MQQTANLKDICKRRRSELLNKIGSSGVAILAASKEHFCSVLPYRQSSDLYYLTYFPEPHSLAVFIPNRKEGEFIIFSEEQNVEKESWFGPIIGQTNACAIFGADQAFPITLTEQIMPQLLADRSEIYFDIGRDSDFDAKVFGWVNQLRAHIRSGINAPSKFIDISKILHEMRSRKDSFEIDLMRKSARISVDAHTRAMKACRADIYEYELAAELLYEFIKQGGTAPAFESIVGSGANTCVLHYNKNNQILKNGDLVVVDAGVDYQHYMSDITRTYPVNGRFTPEQKIIYEIVLEAQVNTINKVKPGITWYDLQLNAQRIITEGLISIGILKGNIDDLLEAKAFKRFYWHNIGHWLGMDEHDVGEYKPNGNWRILEPGMITSIEPGLYISANNTDVDEKWWNIGVRIEDDVLVTENGCEVLTSGLPKTVTDIENLMK